MPYRYKKNADVEYFEPRIEIPYNVLDIADYIRSLKEPERSICTAVILDGEPVKHVASDYKVSRKSIMQIMRSALLPLAEDLGIVPSIPVEELTPPDPPNRPLPAWSERYYPDRKTDPTPAEVVGKLERLSFRTKKIRR